MDKSKVIREIKICLAQNDYESALEKTMEAYSATKDNCFFAEAAKIYNILNRRHDAIKIMQKIFKNDPNNLSNIKSLAYNFFAVGAYKKALKFYELILKFEPQKAESYFNVASMYHFLNNKKNACDYYRFAIKLNPKYISAMNNLGSLYYENKYYDLAIPYFKKAIKLSPNHPEAYHHMGIILREHFNDYEMSKYYIKKALVLDPKYALNSYQLGLTYKALGEVDEAKKCFENCLKLNPNHKETMKELKKIHINE